MMPLQGGVSVVFAGSLMISMLIVFSCNGEDATTPTSSPPTPTATFTATSTSTPSPTPIPTPSSMTRDPAELTVDEILNRAAQQVESTGSLWFRLEHENGFTEALGGLQLSVVEGEVNETSLHIDAEAGIGRIYVEVEAILIENDTWITNPLTGEWEKMLISDGSISFLRPIEAIHRFISELIESDATTMQVLNNGDYSLAAPIRSESLAALLGEVNPGVYGDAEAVIHGDTFEVRSARIKGAMQTHDSADTLRILSLEHYGEDFVIEPPE